MTGPVRLHLSWRRSGDSLDLALAVGRLLARGYPVWWCPVPSGPLEAGDYLVEGPRALGARLAGLGLPAAPWGGRLPRGARRLAPARAVLLAGSASAYPYFAYYALCLARLGLACRPVGGAEVAAGALDGADLLVLPGGFAIWGLDVAERAPGADAAVRGFLARGGACIGSCGGAFYLSAGRPGWTGTAWTRPRYTHEYLQSGTGVVALALEDHPLSTGCPATVEVPYYHGPIYDGEAPGVAVAARFHALALPGRLGIDNPLDARRFARTMAGRPAVLAADGPRGRAVLFSPHPEMGDLIRKYIALDGYVRRYLPVRGHRTMVESLAAYRPLESPAFRLVLNAVHHLTAPPRRRAAAAPAGDAGEPGAGPARAALRRLRRAAGSALASLRLPAGGQGAVARAVARDLEARLEPAAVGLDRELAALAGTRDAERRRILAAWAHLAEAGAAALAALRGRRPPAAEVLMQVELAVCLSEAWRRLIEADRRLGRGAAAR